MTASRTLFVFDLELRQFLRADDDRNVAGGLDQVCALERIEAVYGSTCADHCGSAASFSAHWATTEESRGFGDPEPIVG